MKRKLIEKLEGLKEKYGDIDGIILTREAFHACHPYRPRAWKCDAIQISQDGNRAVKGSVWWDFSEDFDHLEDAADFPWDDVAEDDFKPDEEFDLTDVDDIERLLKQI